MFFKVFVVEPRGSRASVLGNFNHCVLVSDFRSPRRHWFADANADRSRYRSFGDGASIATSQVHFAPFRFAAPLRFRPALLDSEKQGFVVTASTLARVMGHGGVETYTRWTKARALSRVIQMKGES